MLMRLDINGNPFLGVLCNASDRLAIASAEMNAGECAGLSECLGVPVVRTMLGGSRVVGSLCALNSQGIVVSDLASKEELEHLRRAAPGARVLRLAGKLNAVGNNILVNDRAALLHPDMTPSAARRVSDFLGVEVARGALAGIKTVGSAAVVNSKGLLCHPRTTSSERKSLSELFKVPVTPGTANYGSPMVGACVVGNTTGAAAGSPSTGIEMGRIEEGLGFL